MMDTLTHITHMRRAIALARRDEGRTSPNPMVGAVIVKDGRVVGEGYHRRAGEQHAEAEALRDACDAARGAAMYVTLEPCAHYGRTPPCADALIAAGVAEVYYAVGDPNPRVNGKAHAKLEAAGVVVHRGPCEDEARELNRPFFKYVTTGRPFVTAKFAMSLDGKIATCAGDSRWISNEAARQRAHELRNITDVILVGVGTALADDPQLTTRLSPLSLQRKGRVSLQALLDEIGRREMLTLLVEGGSELLGAFFAEKLVDRVWAVIAPLIIGGRNAPGPVGGLGIETLARAIRLRRLQVEMIGANSLAEAPAAQARQDLLIQANVDYSEENYCLQES